MMNENDIIKIDDDYICCHCKSSFKSLELLEKHLKAECKYDISYNNFYIFDPTTKAKYIFPTIIGCGEIYIIQTDFSINNVFKIGATEDIEKRISQYRTGCTFEPKLHYYFPCKNVMEVDNIIKKALVKYNVKREIYKGNIEELKTIILNTMKSISKNNKFCYKPSFKIGDLVECNVCNKIFISKDNYNIHLQDSLICNEINNNNKFQCSLCNNVYNSLDKLNKHKDKCNRNIKSYDTMNQYMCEICDYLTLDKSNYIKHTTTKKHCDKIKLNKESNNICQYCLKKYSNSSSLARHRKACQEKQKIITKYEKKIKDLENKLYNNEQILDMLKNENANLKKLLNI